MPSFGQTARRVKFLTKLDTTRSHAKILTTNMPRPHVKSRKVESTIFQLRSELFIAALCGFRTKTEYYVTQYPYILRYRNAYGEIVLEEYRRCGGDDPIITSLITPISATK